MAETFTSGRLLSHRISAGSLFVLQGIVFATWATRIADIKENLGLNEAQLGTLLFALPVGQILTMALSGMLVNRFGSKRVSNIAAFMYPSALVLISCASSGVQLFACLMVFGCFANLQNIAINTQAVSVEHIYGRHIMGSFHGLWSLAGVCGGVISYFVAVHLSVFWHFLMIAALAFAINAAFGPRLLRKDTKYEPVEGETRTRGMFRPTKFIVILGFIALACMSCEGAMFDWSVIYFEKVVGAPPEQLRLGYVCFMSAMATGRFLADGFVRRFGQIAVLRTCGITMAAGLLFSVIFPGVYTSAFGFLITGFGVSAVIPTCYSAAGKSRRMAPSIALACVSTIGFFGFLFGPPFIGYIAHVSSLRVSLACVACMGIMVALIARTLRTHLK